MMESKGSLRGLSVGLVGGMMESRASRRVVPLAFPSLRSTFHPLYQDMFVLVCSMLSPCQPEMGTKGTATGLYPTFLMKPETSFLISSNLASLYGGSVESILLTATMSCFTPRVYASRACSLVCPFLEIPASNSPVPEAMMSTPQSAWLVPESNVNGDTTLALGLQLVHHPGVLEGSLARLLGLLLELLDGPLVNSTALVDQVTGGGGLARVHVADNHNVDV